MYSTARTLGIEKYKYLTVAETVAATTFQAVNPSTHPFVHTYARTYINQNKLNLHPIP